MSGDIIIPDYFVSGDFIGLNLLTALIQNNRLHKVKVVHVFLKESYSFPDPQFCWYNSRN